MRVTKIENGYVPRLNNQKKFNNNIEISSPAFTAAKPPRANRLALILLGLYSIGATFFIARNAEEAPVQNAITTEIIDQTQETDNAEKETEIASEPLLTNAEKQKLKEVKNFIYGAKNIEEEMGKDTWNNFNEFYGITKEKGAIWFDEQTEWAPATDSYKDYYESYALTSKIASGDTSFIQEKVKTEQDAMMLMSELLIEILNSNGSHEEIDNGRNVNAGETRVLHTVLDEFDKMSPEIQTVSRIFREEFDRAQAEAQAKSSIAGLDSRLENDENGEYAKYLTGKYDDILLDYEQMFDIKKDYDGLKGQITDPTNIDNETFTNLYYMNLSCDELFGRICETCLLDKVYENPNIVIDQRSLEDASFRAYQRCWNEFGEG